MTSPASSSPCNRPPRAIPRLILFALFAAAFFLAPTAQASAAEFLLEVQVTGEGNVGCKADGGPIESCEAEYPEGTQVTVIAEPEEGSEFVEWTGECDSTSGNECEVEMNAEKTIEVVFGLEEFEVTVETEGSGKGFVECQVDGGPYELCPESETYPYGTVLILFAEEEEGSEFIEWGGECSGIEAECELTVEEPLSVTALFELGPFFVLTVEAEGSGEGVVECEAEGPVEECEAEGEYPEGTVVTLYAEAKPGSEFVKWTGECDVTTGNECEVEMSEAKTVGAVFAARPPVSLTVNLAGEGEGEVECEVNGGAPEECEAEYSEGTELALVAIAETGSEFAGFSAGSGSASACSTSPCSFTIEANSSVTATFDLEPTPKFTLKVKKTGSGTGKVESTSPVSPKIVCGAECEKEFEEGTVVTLSQSADPGSEFVKWTGACTGSGACEVTMSAAKEVTAEFNLKAKPKFTLKVKKTGSGTGKVESTSPVSPKIVCGAECEKEFEEGTVVTLSQSADPGSEFVKWTGACTGSGACEVTMSAAKEVTAEFNLKAKPKFTLKVKKEGTGTGTVTSSPAGISCGSTCEAEFEEGTKILLTATASAGSIFVEWIGCDNEPAPGQCEVTVGAGKEVKAIFNLIPKFTLKVKKIGSGSGKVESTSPVSPKIVCGAECEKEFEEGTKVTLSQSADAGSEFVKWTGACTGTGACEVTMSAAKEVTAEFNLEPPSEFALTVSLAGTGSGTVTSSPAGVNCGIDCSEAFAADTEVTLTAAPASGSTFGGWSGSCTGTGTCKVTMSQARGVTATFEKAPTPPPSAGTAVVANTAKVKSGKAQLKLTCKGEGPCKGSLKLKAKIKSGGRTKNLTIGKASFSLAAGASQTLKVKLSGPARQALAKGPLKAKVSGTGVAGSTVKLKLAK